MNRLAFDDRAISVLKTLKDAGFSAWFVGGCVRDALAGVDFSDYDLAASALPLQITKVFKEFELNLQGISFGCVRVKNEGLWVEITTLREDINPDGRHTNVNFTDDLAKDAKRRDFTINGLYWDGSGSTNDFHHGKSDLAEGIVCFIGDPNDRVPQDYLRILRFFRFSSRYGDSIEQKGLRACGAHQEGLRYLSGERVWYEWSRTLFAKNARMVLEAMRNLDIDITLFGGKFDLDIHKTYQGHDPLLLTVLLLPSVNAQHLAHRLSLSGKQSDWLQLAVSLKPAPDFRILYLEHGDAAKELVYFWACKYTKNHEEILNEGFWDVKNPVFPLSGKDLIKLDCQPGPIVGNYLKCARQWWAEKNFSPTYQDCLRYVESLLNK